MINICVSILKHFIDQSKY